MQQSIQRLLLALVLFVGILMPSTTWAGLSIVPTLVVIEGRERFADVNLINTSSETKTYEVRWRFFEMEEGTGSYLDKEKSLTEFSLADHVVFTPRRVKLEPNKLQKIRLGLRLNGEPPAPGDYRAHLEFKEINPSAPVNQSANDGSEKATVGVKINFGFSIPVVYRVGESNVKAQIGDVKSGYNEKTKHLELVVPVSNVSSGNYSLLGHLMVYQGDKLIGEQKNANIFSEVKNRTFNVMLNVDRLDKGSVRVVYMEAERGDKARAKFAEKTIAISN